MLFFKYISINFYLKKLHFGLFIYLGLVTLGYDINIIDKLFNYIPTEASFTPLRDLKDVPSKPIKIELIKK